MEGLMYNKVTEQAEMLDINTLFLPPYSPNLNLIERLWKFTKKKVSIQSVSRDILPFQGSH